MRNPRIARPKTIVPPNPPTALPVNGQLVAVKKFDDWPYVNQNFHRAFRQWLADGGYGDSAITQYSVASRWAFGILDKPYWAIHPETDFQLVRDYIAVRPLTPVTRRHYANGLVKLGQFIAVKCHKPLPELVVNWDYYLAPLPQWLADDVRLYVQHCLRTRRPEDQHRARLETLGPLTAILRWMAANMAVTSLDCVTPDVWYVYVEAELARGIQPVTLNHKLYHLQAFLGFLADSGETVCPRTRLIEPLKERRRIPKDAPVEQVRAIWEAIQATAQSAHGLTRRYAVMDRAWFLLMLHSGLRSGEVRRLTFSDLDFEAKRVRIEQSKGLKDRMVPLSAAAMVALQEYLPVRGPKEGLPERVFIAKHQPLGRRYFGIRLKKYEKMTGIRVTAHQLRHTCATLLLNAGAPILTVQAILGHKYVTTTLGYARLYDGTVAADYYRAMEQVEKRLPLIADVVLVRKVETQPNMGKLLALVDSLRGGTLNESQSEKLQLLRAGILALAEQDNGRAKIGAP
ncbi:MAG: phage integrase family protein [Chloroflexi bacterium]|nr:phage integrase family protein [Chloroflexota bacterium]